MSGPEDPKCQEEEGKEKLPTSALLSFKGLTEEGWCCPPGVLSPLGEVNLISEIGGLC